MTYILGVSAYYHDSAATLIKDGKIIAAAQEERFTRKKHDPSFPTNAILYCLKEAGIALSDVSYIAFYDKPLLKFERLLETYLSFAPKGLTSFFSSMPVWLNEKLFLRSNIKKALKSLDPDLKELPELLFTEHHQSHAASAFFASPYDKAAVLCLDGVGEWVTTSLWKGEGRELRPIWDIRFPHSLGLLYSAFTYYTGFKVNSGEYKLMGLAPYGKPVYVDIIKKHLVDIKEDGSFRLDMQYFDYCTGLRMTNKNFEKLFGFPARDPESEITQRYMDMARSIQEVTEEIMLKLAVSVQAETGMDNLCLAGGVALNCVANGRLLREGPFKNIWIQPAAGDAGGALGAAMAAWYGHLEKPRISAGHDQMEGAYLGPEFSDHEAQQELDSYNAVYAEHGDDALFDAVSKELEEGKVIAWFQGRMEFGPRALGNRSIIGDARNTQLQSVMNLKIKFRESFRPFAPAVLEQDVGKYFQMSAQSPYMLLVSPVNPDKRLAMTMEQELLFGIDKLKVSRSTIPAVTHVDYSARIQTVSEKTNKRFHDLLSAFKRRTGDGILINTSFNVRGEPIVCTPGDAYRCFMRTEMDTLVVGNLVIKKSDQPVFSDKGDWRNEYQLD